MLTIVWLCRLLTDKNPSGAVLSLRCGLAIGVVIVAGVCMRLLARREAHESFDDGWTTSERGWSPIDKDAA